MNIKKIEIKNFKAFKKQDITASENHPCFICGKNGSGKSTILEAIMWCFNQYTALGHYEQIINDEVLKNTREEIPINVSVIVYCLDIDNREYKIERINTYEKKQSQVIKVNESSAIYRVHRLNGMEKENKLKSNDLIERLSNSLFVCNRIDLNNLAKDLLRFISNKYRVNYDTASSVLDLIIKNSNTAFHSICKKNNLRINYEDRRIELINEEGIYYSGSMSENCECTNAILLSLKEFDNDVCLMIDEPLTFLDGEDCKLFINYLAKINYQIISTIQTIDVECFPELKKFLCCFTKNHE